jgi:MOSC domain-containing protein YiiM
LRILSIHAGRRAPLAGTNRESAIAKAPLHGPVVVGTLGADGDEQVDRRHHGGESKALCVYPSEHYPKWRAHTGRQMPIGSFGENLSTLGWFESDACVGDLIGAGECRFRVTGPRVPCGTLASHWQTEGFQTAVRESGMSGFYLSVESSGRLVAGEDLVLLDRPFPQWSISALWEKVDGRRGSREEFEELLGIEALDEDWKQRARRLLA